MAGERRTEDRVVPAYGITVQRLAPPGDVPNAAIINVSSTGVAFFAEKLFIPGEKLTFVCEDRDPVEAKVIGCERMLTGKVRVRCKIAKGAFDLGTIVTGSDESAA